MRNHTAKRILSLFLMFTVLFTSLSYSAVAVQALEEDALDSVKLNISFTFQHYIDTYSFPQSTHRVKSLMQLSSPISSTIPSYNSENTVMK